MLKSSQSASWNHSAEPLPAGGMEGDQVRAAVAAPQAARHGLDDRAVRVVFDRPVTAENPDDARILVARAQPLAVGRGIRGGEDLLSDAPFLVPLVAPRRQHTDVQPERAALFTTQSTCAKYASFGLRRVIVDERYLAVRLRRAEAIEFGQDDGLDDGEAPFRAIAQVPFGILAIQPMEQLPRRVAEPEERLAVVVHQEAPVLGHLQPGERLGRRGLRHAQRDDQHGHARDHP